MNKKSFTLIEVLVVVFILGILIAVLVPRLMWSKEMARDTARQAWLTQISQWLQMYKDDVWNYPTNLKCVTIWADVSWTFQNVLKDFLKELPVDPNPINVAYWTKIWWCWSWNYAYVDMIYQWKDAEWFVLIANTESVGKLSNWVLADWFDTTPSFVNTWTVDEEISDTDNSYQFKNRENALGHMCAWWVLEVVEYDYWLSKCKASSINQMSHVRFR